MSNMDKKGSGKYHPHGGYSNIWRRAVKGELDGRSLVARAVRDLRAALVSDLGGGENLSTQQSLIVDRAVCKSFQCQAIEQALYEGEELPHTTLAFYLSLSTSLRKDLAALGLQRVAKRVGDAEGVDLNKLSIEDLDKIANILKKGKGD